MNKQIEFHNSKSLTLQGLNHFGRYKTANSFDKLINVMREIFNFCVIVENSLLMLQSLAQDGLLKKKLA